MRRFGSKLVKNDVLRLTILKFVNRFTHLAKALYILAKTFVNSIKSGLKNRISR